MKSSKLVRLIKDVGLLRGPRNDSLANASPCGSRRLSDIEMTLNSVREENEPKKLSTAEIDNIYLKCTTKGEREDKQDLSQTQPLGAGSSFMFGSRVSPSMAASIAPSSNRNTNQMPNTFGTKRTSLSSQASQFFYSTKSPRSSRASPSPLSHRGGTSELLVAPTKIDFETFKKVLELIALRVFP